MYAAARDPDFAGNWGATVRGSMFEDHFWAPALRHRFGANLLFAGTDQQTFTHEFLSATPDALLINQLRDVLAPLGVPDIGKDGSLVLECKTADPRTALDAAKPEHVFQVQCQLGLIHELTEHQPEYALISYTDASFWSEGKEFAVKFDPATYANAKRRAQMIMTATAAEELPPEGWIAGGAECKYCPFTRACGRKRHDVPQQTTAEPDPQFVAEIADLAHAVKQQEADADLATTKLRELQHEMRERLRNRGINRVTGHGVSVTWSPVKGRQSFDMKRIREAAAAAGIDLSEYETVGEPIDRLVITIRGNSR
jgi:hypothetical protein